MSRFRFAHLTDCHLGSWGRSPKLRELNLKAFEKAIEMSIAEDVDFIVITGDFFDVNLPDLEPVKRAVEILKSVQSQGIPVYLIYGSHDFTPNAVSMIDVLHSAGLFIKPTENEMAEKKLKLKFLVDKKTGAKIVGLSGRAKSLDVPYYEILDTESLEAEPGFKIFLLHAPIAEITPGDLSFGNSIPLSSLPKGFKYYGGGHLHRRIEHTTKEGGKIVYPGPLFGATFPDLEETALGEKRGFCLVTYDGESVRTDFIEVKLVDVIYEVIDAENKTSRQAEAQLNSVVDQLDSSGKVVLIKMTGTLSTGKSSEIDFSRAERTLVKGGAVAQFINRLGLKSRETEKLRVAGQSKEEIETKILRERIARFSVDPTINDKRVREALKARLVAERGEQTAKSLLRALEIEKLENQPVAEFKENVVVRTEPYIEPEALEE